MAGPISPTPVTSDNTNENYQFAFAVMTSLFFIWGFITALNDILIPYLKGAFDLSFLQASLVQFCFFGAYFIVSPFAGILIDKIGYKKGVMTGLAIIAAGCILFYPAAEVAIYAVFLFALFVLAAGIAVLQVSANPYVATLGPAKTAASRLNLAQAVNSVGHTFAPLFGASLILATMDNSEPGSAKSVQLPYLIIAAAMILTAFVFSRLHLPTIKREEKKATEKNNYLDVFSKKHFTFGVVAIFLYVGAEVTVGSYLVNYFMQLNIEGMTQVSAGKMVSYYWGAAMIGRFVGAVITRFINPALVLAFNSAFAVAMVILTLTTAGEFAMWSILAVGFFNSIMFPTIFSLAIKDLGEHTGTGSGFLCQAIFGGAVLPLIQGFVADQSSLQFSFIVPACCYVYIAWYALYGSKVKHPE